MKIEEMRDSDLHTVQRLACQLGYDCTAEEVARRFEALHRSPSHRLLVARELAEKRVVGWIHLAVENFSLLGEARADVAALVVDEKFRGGGIGAALLKAGEAWAQEQGLGLLRVRTNTQRVRAHRFYERAGYKLSKTSHLFVKEI
jgi:GNAT superfamily N-acetyltransferase